MPPFLPPPLPLPGPTWASDFDSDTLPADPIRLRINDQRSKKGRTEINFINAEPFSLMDPFFNCTGKICYNGYNV